MKITAIIEKIEACARLTTSDKPFEAISAADRARDLMGRHEIDASVLSPAARMALKPFDAAGWLIVAGHWTRWAAEVGGSRDEWHVTGAGVVSEAEMMRFARERGYTRMASNQKEEGNP